MSNSVQVFDGNGNLINTYGTIQAAVNASSDGWTIRASAGTYDEHVVLNRGVTLEGANTGIGGADGARGAETIITGGVELSADGVTVSGVEISGSYDTEGTGHQTFPPGIGLLIDGADATISNSVFTGDGATSTPVYAFASATGFAFDHNLVQGWNYPGELALGSSGSITHNTFSDNSSGSIFAEALTDFEISGNSFSGSIFAYVKGSVDLASLDLGDVLHDNTFISTLAEPIVVNLTGPDGQVVNGTDTPTVFDVGLHIGAAEIHGGTGSDTLSYSSGTVPATIDLNTRTSSTSLGTATFTSIENAFGSPAGDNITGDAHDNIIAGLDGDDHLDGGAGNDTASYADAASRVQVSLASPTGQDTLGAGIDTLTNFENLTGSAFNDGLFGDAGANILSGLAGDDVLSGGAGNDTLSGAAGNDNLNGGIGNDTLDGGAGSGDEVTYGGATAGVTVNLAIGTAQNTIGAGIDTLVGIENLTGSNLNDTFTGNADANIFIGQAGDDTLNGGAGNDTLLAGQGTDILNGGTGNDIIAGNYGDTVTYADATAGVTVNLDLNQQNTIGAGIDTLIGSTNLTGSAFNDTLTGNFLANVISGLAGNDILMGDARNDTLSGGAGNDVVDGGEDNDSMDGGAGTDTASYADAFAGVSVNLAIAAAQNTIGAGTDTLTNLENLTGSNFNDTLTGNAAANILNGGAGNDTLLGGAGNDSLGGAAGSDTASYADATGAVSVNLAITTAQNTLGAGTDTLVSIENLTGSNLNDTLTGNTLANILNGGAGNDTLTGGAGNDSLEGGAGNDSLIGAVGNDTLNGAAGNDSMNGGAAGTDTASYQAGATAGVSVSLAITTAQNTIGAGVDTLINFENLIGTAFNDTLTGNSGANVIDGLTGNDTLNGGAGNDTLTGGGGNDSVNGGAGNDRMDGGAAGTDTVSYETGATTGVKVSLAIATAQNTLGAGTDTLLNFENLTGSGFNDILAGDAGANTLSGLASNDSLNGDAGNDSLSGGAGNDRLIGGTGNDSLDGGVGADSFIFDKGSWIDTITGFATTGAGHDTIDFSTAVFANFAAVQSHMVQSGANVIISLDSYNTVILKNVTLASLTAADFTFHSGTAPAAPAQAAAAAWAAHGAEANSHLHLG